MGYYGAPPAMRMPCAIQTTRAQIEFCAVLGAGRGPTEQVCLTTPAPRVVVASALLAGTMVTGQLRWARREASVLNIEQQPPSLGEMFSGAVLGYPIDGNNSTMVL